MGPTSSHADGFIEKLPPSPPPQSAQLPASLTSSLKLTMPTTRKKLILNSVSSGCGSCRRPKLIISRFFNPKPRPRPASNSKSYRKPNHYDTAEEKHQLKGFGRVGGESMAVEKDSNDPYLDFKHSMLQMILEKEIYSKEELRDLLNCFLQLNSPYYHGVIIRAFTEIWNGVFSVKQSNSPNLGHYYRR